MAMQMQYGAGKKASTGNFFELIWENSSPTSSFSAQTVNLDLSPYMAIAIEINTTTSGSVQAIGLIMVGTSGVAFGRSGSSGTTYGRGAAVTSAGVTFANGYSGSTAGSGYAIPRRIWGIR